MNARLVRMVDRAVIAMEVSPVVALQDGLGNSAMEVRVAHYN